MSDVGIVPQAAPARVCSGCHYWDTTSIDPHTVPGGSGLTRFPSDRCLCRRYPSVVFKGPDEWCGEWQKA